MNLTEKEKNLIVEALRTASTCLMNDTSKAYCTNELADKKIKKSNEMHDLVTKIREWELQSDLNEKLSNNC